MKEDFLSTYGEWNLDEFLKCHDQELATLVLVEVVAVAKGQAGSDVVGEVVLELWQALTESFGTMHGHRLSWGTVAFILPVVCSLQIGGDLAAALPESRGVCEVRLGGTQLTALGRAEQLEEFQWRFRKTDSRQEYAGGWYFRNGVREYPAD